MKVEAADLFCGAGGTSTAILQAGDELGLQVNLLAINHWRVAINTHSLNHPNVRHLCESLENISPRKAVPSRRLRIMAASPQCTHHSIAASARPRNDQSRATAWHVCHWAADLTIDNILIENVPEFQTWGPLTKRGFPMKRRKGETFRAFINALRSMGYNVEYRVQNAADFGDATSRRRLIIMARRSTDIVWPDHTHGTVQTPHCPARGIIDFEIKSKSIFNRNPALKPRTIERIVDGMNQFNGPFLVKFYGRSSVASLNEPLPTITAQGNHLGLCEPFIILTTHHGKRAAHSIDRPLPTITCAKRGEMALVQPFIVKYYGSGIAKSVDKPLDTITGKARFGLVQPSKTSGDILFRMLQPPEYAAAMSFPAHYQFAGTKADKVKQIGNAVPVRLARAHARALLS